uniref:Uncharacterized protein n=1 Tax=Panagrolaimus davidi TaxID=227884 RepID=A0A914QJ14_9BILA
MPPAECPDFDGDASFLRHADKEYVLYISPTQLETLRKTLKLKGDGTFKYTPKGYRQIFRLFGCVQKTKGFPVATVIMLKKSKKLYIGIYVLYPYIRFGKSPENPLTDFAAFFMVKINA